MTAQTHLASATETELGPCTIQGIELLDGLSAKEVDVRLERFGRLRDIGNRGLAFYLLEIHERRLYSIFGHSDTRAYAQAKHDLSPRRTRELLAAGRALRELPLIDEAFCAQQINWTKTLALTWVATPEHEKAWLEKALSVGTRQLRLEVASVRKGDAPRDPRNRKGTPETRFPLRTTLPSVTQRSLELAQKKLSAERGRAAKIEEVLEVALEVYRSSKRTDESDGWKHQPTYPYRIQLRPAFPGENAPLVIETEEGIVPIGGSGDGDDVIARQREACAHCDSLVTDGDDGAQAEKDRKTEERLRLQVLARDGQRCRCCGAHHPLHVHHIVFRAQGGRTVSCNLISICIRCHSLVHAGLLMIEGEREEVARFLDAEGHPLHGPGRRVNPRALVKLEAPQRRTPVIVPGGSPRSAPRSARATLVTLDDLPATVTGTWWTRHADRLRCRPEGGLEWKPGESGPEPVGDEPVGDEPVGDEPVGDEAVNLAEDQAGNQAEPAAPRRTFDDAFAGIVGQEAFLERVRFEADGAAKLGEPFPHALFYGRPGTGKTTLARRLAACVGSRLVRRNGPLLGDTAAMLRLLATLREGDVLFLDEVHAVPREALEVLYQAMEERRLTLAIHQGPRERSLELELPAFTVLAATTEEAEVSDALRSRFAIRHHVDVYTEADLARMACAQTEARGLRLEPQAALDLAACARGVPRLTRELVGSACRAAASWGAQVLGVVLIRAVLDKLSIGPCGLGPVEQVYLAALAREGGPMSKARLAIETGVSERTVEREIEPLLRRLGFVRVTARGRVLLKPPPVSANPHFKPFPGRRPIAARGAVVA